MEALAGSTFGIEVSSPAAASAAAYGVANPSQEEEIVGSGTFIGAPDDDSSDSSSLIGAPGGSDEEGEEVESVTALNSLDSIEESLPIKRGLSNHFAGKSKSFASLADVVTSSSSITVKDLEKPEHPFNKRRRLLLANRWARKSFYNWSNPKSMPLLTLNEEDEHQEQDQQIEEDDDDEEDQSQVSRSSSSSEHEILRNQPGFSKIQEVKFKRNFKSHSCFSLTDLQHEEIQ